jgi:hypothetical protein
MKELQELRNEILHLRNMGGLNKQTESILLNKLNALEVAINHTRYSTDLPTSTQLLSDCKNRFKNLKANNYKFDYRSYQNGYLDSFSKYAVSKTK